VKDDKLQENHGTTEVGAEESVASLKQEIERLQAELKDQQELVHRNLRLQADMDNLRKRTAREKDEWWQNAAADILIQLLPVVDNFERALSALPEGAAGGWAQGIVMVGRQMADTMEKLGLQPVCAEGLFDPECHEALMQDTESDLPENTITAEFERGYTFRGRVIRPSKVRVSTGGKKNE
jgi:molecular chaperone GrpE